ncbi:MAG: phosphatidate cytidylyltransferase [Caldilinea sp. CFX5]|nr:phosphatidate cytidylyltransferase [Caldilinea sp. CFX5]
MSELLAMAPVALFIGLLFVLLTVATAVVQWLCHRHPEQDFTELKQRVRSWWVMVALFGVVILLNRTVTLLFIAALCFLALREFLTIIPTRRADHRLLLWAYLAIPIQFFWISLDAQGMFLIFIPIYMLLFLTIYMVLEGETKGFLNAASSVFWGLMLIVFGLSHIAYLLTAGLDHETAAGGVGLVLYLVFLTQFNDVSQYIFGKLLGRRPILPKVSPRKTWEGFLGGVLTTTVLAWLLAPWLTALLPWQALLIGLLLGVGGFAGDVTISAIKRDLALKDTGALIPGHGGILDRIDSLTYTAPLFFHVVAFFYR